MKAIGFGAILVTLLAGIGLGYGLSQVEFNKSTAATSEKQEKKVLYWVAPMDANYRRDKPGKSPMGMDLVPVYEGADMDDGGEKALKISAAVVNNIGVRTAKVEKKTLHQMIDTVGFLTPDDDLTRDIHVRTDGWIEKLTVRTEGDNVKKGGLLFQFYSRELTTAQAEYVQALEIGQKILAEAALARLEALGMSRLQIMELQSSRKVANLVNVYTPQDGYVVALNVREGMFIQPKMTIFTLADLSSIWVMVEVYEHQASIVAKGQLAEMRLPFLPGKIWEGEVDHVYPTVDPQSRTIRVRLRFKNLDQQLKPNMYADITIHGKAKESVVAIPREALIRTGKSERVILALGEGRFRPAQVVSGMESEDRIEIVVGLKEGETIVTSGQFLLDSEASLDASLLRMADAGEKAENQTDAQMDIMGKGTIETVKMADRKLNITHEPIPAIGWPTMTMDFRIGKGVDIDAVKEGDKIDFMLKRDKTAGDYVIESISKGGQMVAENKSPGVAGAGVIKKVKGGERKLNITHEPIPSIGWPTMTMDFRIGKDVDIDAVKAGDSVDFMLKRDKAAGDYVIESISKGGQMVAEKKSPGVATAGVVKQVKAGERKLNITHEPIPSIGWPTMTMDFRIGKDVDIDAVKAGDSVDFMLKRDKAAGDYVIESISKSGKK